ncbi:hypothetical protein MKX01_012629 [Papaver californicum]|nr:hypothetical protein MKX01_012629 [Papaver californicum]
MVNQGRTLSATSRSDYSLLSSQLGIREIDNFMDEDHDVILICTSILSLSQVLKSVPIHRLKKPTLFMEEHPKEGCRMVEMSCEEHDKLVARSQFLTQTVARKQVLSEMEIESTTMDTKGFQNLVQLKETLVTDSFDLYPGLFVHNRFAKQELKNLELALETVKQKLITTIDDTL